MKTLTLLPAIAAAFTVSAPAFAQDTTTPVETHKAHSASAEAGHWEWQPHNAAAIAHRRYPADRVPFSPIRPISTVARA